MQNITLNINILKVDLQARKDYTWKGENKVTISYLSFKSNLRQFAFLFFVELGTDTRQMDGQTVNTETCPQSFTKE